MWQITKINNATHEVTMLHADGTTHDFTVPHEHAHSSKVKMAYIKSKMEELSPKKEEPVPKQESFLWLKVLSAIEALIIVGLLLFK